MTASAVPGALGSPEAGPAGARVFLERLGVFLDGLIVPSASVLVSVVLFGGFVGLAGANPIEVYEQMYRAGSHGRSLS
jgi:hypothetical protein